jgi:hypothetical protein
MRSDRGRQRSRVAPNDARRCPVKELVIGPRSSKELERPESRMVRMREVGKGRAMSVSATPAVAESLCECLEPALRELAGQDQLALQTITTVASFPPCSPASSLCLGEPATSRSTRSCSAAMTRTPGGRALRGLTTSSGTVFELGVAAT